MHLFRLLQRIVCLLFFESYPIKRLHEAPLTSVVWPGVRKKDTVAPKYC